MKLKLLAKDDQTNCVMREIIEFLSQMPTDTKLFLTMAVLGLAVTLIVWRWLI